MAGINYEIIEDSKDIDTLEIELKDNKNYYNFTYLQDELLDFTNPLYFIGNKKSSFYEKYANNNYEFKIDNFKSQKRNECSSKQNFVDYKTLPVYAHKDHFLKAFDLHDIILITGDTGCGKSTLVPKFIYDKYKSRICVTQPRRLSVKNLYERMKIFYPHEVGYAIQYEHNIYKNTKIKYLTEGILLKELSSDPLLLNYDVVICDEIHERSVDLDIILGYLKLLSKRRNNIKIILMSATIQISDITNFFDCYTFHFSGVTFPVDIKYLKVDVDDYIEWTSKKILNVHTKEPKGDILVFLSGKEDISQIYKILRFHLDQTYNLDIIPLYAEIMNEVYDKIFNIKSEFRRCILATNIAETSITIKNVKYVIDTGFHKIGFYDYSSGDRLIKYPISKENAIQRAGRAGRTEPGICYRMYTEKSYYEYMIDKNIPNILKSNISNTILLLLSTNYKKIESFPVISKPPKNSINCGISMLHCLGCIDNSFNLTKDGREILNLGIDVLLGKLVLEGIKNECSFDATLLVSILSLDITNIFSYFKQENNTEYYDDCIVPNNDFISLLNLFKLGYKKRDFGTKIVNRVQIIHENLLKKIDFLGYKRTFSSNIDVTILKTFFFNICKKEEDCFVNLFTKTKLKINNKEVDYKYLLFYKSFKTKNRDILMQISMEVNPEDILLHLPNFYKDKNDKEDIRKNDSIFVFDNLYEKFELETE